MKIVLAGGTGFIGSALLPRLAAAGHTVVALSRSPSSRMQALSPGMSVAPWDGASMGEWASHIDGADAVVNLAGEPLAAKRWTGVQKARILRSRIDATRILREAIANARQKPSVFLQMSAVGYYGDIPEGDVREDHGPGSDFLARTCQQWEFEASGMVPMGLRLVVLRLGVVLGDHGGALQKMVLPYKLFLGGAIGGGSQWLPWIHRDDVAGIMMFALERTVAAGPVNVVAPDLVTMKTFCATLGQVLHRPSWAAVPGALVRAALGEMADMLLTGQRVVPARIQEWGYSFRYPTLLSALTDILD